LQCSSDRILVLDGGELAEFDTPAALLRQPDSAFSSIIAEMGESAAERLLGLANEAEEKGIDISSQKTMDESKAECKTNL
jgi:ABC-type proline/glycine betaine transport system ATPase subunit